MNEPVVDQIDTVLNEWDGSTDSMSWTAAAPPLPEYPHASGDAMVLGPETFISADLDVISHKGENYYRLKDLGDSK
jgi:hypothetical protein